MRRKPSKLEQHNQRHLPTVIIYRHDLLPLSETFIAQQAAALTKWRPVLAGERLTSTGLHLEGFKTVLLRDQDKWINDFYFRACRRLRLPHQPSVRRLRKIGAQVVHVHFGTDAVDIWPTVRELKLPMLVTLHGYDINIHRAWWEAGGGGKRRRRYPTQLLALAKESNVQFVAVSEAIRQQAIKFGIDGGKIEVRYVGIDTNQFVRGLRPIAQREKRVLFVGRLVEKKGVATLIRSFSQVRAHVKGAELIIVGDGPLSKDLEQLARDEALPITFAGSCSSEEVRKMLNEARVLCLPSVTAGNGDAEGFGMVLLEAQASGIPVVTSARGGAAEGIIDGQTGFSFAEGDQVALVDKITRLLSDDELVTRMSDGAISFVKSRFEIGHLTALLETDYFKISKHCAQRTN